jgi:hypothetical protein
VSYALTPRPELPPEELAAVVVAIEELMREQRVIVDDAVPVWRFSGRWFNSGRFANRRPHPLN